MQDQEEGGRYLVQELDGSTWSILDLWTRRGYALLLTRVGNFTVQLVLTEVMASGSPRYMHFLAEIMSASIEVYDEDTVPRVARFILDELVDDLELANPVTIARQLGADLHGQRVDWVPVRELQ